MTTGAPDEMLDRAALSYAVLFYAAGAYPVLQEMPRDRLQEMITAVQDFTGEVAPYRGKKGFPKREIPGLGEISIIKAIAVSSAYLVAAQLGLLSGTAPVETVEELRRKSLLLSAACDGLPLAGLGDEESRESARRLRREVYGP